MMTFEEAEALQRIESHLTDARRGRKSRERKRRRTRALRRGALCAAALLALTACPMPTAAEAEPRYKAAHTVQAPEAEEPENELIEAALLASAHVIEACTVTHYDACAACCGKTDGITASGVRAAPYITCAVDPDVIPMGSDLLVDYGDGELHYYRADDVGGAVQGNHIDLCASSHAEAVALCVRTATVYWVEQEG